MSEPLEFFTSLTRQESIARLTDALATHRGMARVVKGSISGDRLELSYQQNLEAPTTVLVATIHSHDGGSHIAGHFFLAYGDRLFRAISLGFVYAVGGVVVTLSLYGALHGQTTNRLLAWLAPCLFGGLIALLRSVIQRMFRLQAETLRALLRDELEANPTANGA